MPARARLDQPAPGLLQARRRPARQVVRRADAPRLADETDASRVALDLTRIDDGDVEKVLDQAWDVVRGLPGVRDSTALWGPIRDILGITRRNRVKRDLYAFTASELRTDLLAALAGYERRVATGGGRGLGFAVARELPDAGPTRRATGRSA